jgi:ATP-dependent Zn protease
MNFIKFMIAVAIILFFGGLAGGQVAEGFARAGGDVRVFSPSAEAVGELAIAVVGNNNRINMSQVRPERQPTDDDNNDFVRGMFTSFLVILLIAVVIVMFAVMSQQPSEKEMY